jgi:hypothetical protein
MERWGAIPAVFVIIINVAALTAMVEDLEKKDRVERELNTRLTVDLDLAPRRNPRAYVQLPIDDQTVGIIGKFAGALIRCRPASVTSGRQGHVEVRIGNCPNLIEPDPNIYDAIATDAPMRSAARL